MKFHLKILKQVSKYRADRETMMATAGGSSAAPRDGWEANLVDQNKDPVPPPYPGV